MIGQIYLKRRQETSYNGQLVADLKSGLQKYARRALLDKGLWCLVELDLFQVIESDPAAVDVYVHRHGAGLTSVEEERLRRLVVQRARAVRTNLLNRLLVMVSEEVSLACFSLPLHIDRLAQRWQADRHHPRSRKYLVDLYQSLCAARKIRLISDIKSVYLLPPDCVSPGRQTWLEETHADLLGSLGLSALLAERSRVTERLLERCAVPLRSDEVAWDGELEEALNGILYNLKQKSDHVFYWLGRLIDHGRDAAGEARFGGRRDPLNLVWRVLLEFAVRREALWGEAPRCYPDGFNQLLAVLVVVKKWYDRMTHREKPIYLYHALLLVVRRDQIDWEVTVPTFDTPEQEVEALYQSNLAGRKLTLDPFVLDLHTGRRGAGALARFAREGALVVNEDVPLRNEDYRKVYLGLKERLDANREGKSNRRRMHKENA